MSARSRGTLEVLALDPKPGSVLGRNSLLRAQLKFTIEMRPGTEYRLFAQFRSTDPNRTFGVANSPETEVEPDAPSGEVDLALPIYQAYQPSLALPIQVRFLLTEFYSPSESVSIAWSEFFEYQGE